MTAHRSGPSAPSSIAGRTGRTLPFIVASLLLSGCASWTAVGDAVPSTSLRYRSASPPSLSHARDLPPAAGEDAPPANPTGTGGAGASAGTERPEEADAFEAVLMRAGLDRAGELPPSDRPLWPGDAAALYGALLRKPVTLSGFGPWRVATHLLRQVMVGGAAMPREELVARVGRFQQLAVLRPDGALAWALSGAPQQRVGEVQWTAGAFRAYQFEVGPFYSAESGAWRRMDEDLRSNWDAPALAEVSRNAGLFPRAPDNTTDAFVERALALEPLLSRPGDSLSALRQLPEGLVDLLDGSPGFLARFRLMTRGEQARVISRLTTAVLATCGTAASSACTRTPEGPSWETLHVPALALTAEGTLVLGRASPQAAPAVTGTSSASAP